MVDTSKDACASGGKHLLQGRQQTFQFIKGYNHLFGVERMCKALSVSKSGYYEWLKRKPSKRFLENQKLTQEIREIYHESRCRYGSPKITRELHDQGWRVSRPRVARIMRYENMRSIVVKRFRGITTDANHSYPVALNILNREFEAEHPGQKWVSDITYIPTEQGWVYLTIIMDLFDRKVVGWSLSTSMETNETTLPAWKMAIGNRPISPGLIFHSDQGVQYAAYAFVDEINRHNVIQSMSRKGNCWDNAVAESFFKILKSEAVKHCRFKSIFEAKMEVFEFIEGWYNRKRKHAKLGYLTPEGFWKINYTNCA